MVVCVCIHIHTHWLYMYVYIHMGNFGRPGKFTEIQRSHIYIYTLYVYTVDSRHSGMFWSEFLVRYSGDSAKQEDAFSVTSLALTTNMTFSD